MSSSGRWAAGRSATASNTRRGYSWSAYGTSAWNSAGGSAARGADGAGCTARAREIKPRISRTPMLLILCGALFLFGFADLTQVAQAARTAKEVATLKQQLAKANADNLLLVKDINEYGSATRVRSEALNRLGMVEPVQQITVEIPQIAAVVSTSAVADTADAGSWLDRLLNALGGV